jgi:uncharacterized membrane protein
MDEITLVIRGFPRFAWIALLPLLLGCYYIFVTEATTSSKSIIAAVLVLSLIILLAVPSYWLWILLLQTAVGIYVVFYLAWNRH